MSDLPLALQQGFYAFQISVTVETSRLSGFHAGGMLLVPVWLVLKVEETS